jgi:hypothetical protein
MLIFSMLFQNIPQQHIYLVSFFRLLFEKPAEQPGKRKKVEFYGTYQNKKSA